MRILKKILVIVLSVSFVISASVFYAFKIEPYRIKVNKYTLNEQESDKSSVKIIQISDLHLKEDYTYENLRRIVSHINSQSPDIVLFTGDLYDNYAKYRDDENVIAEFSRIDARYDKIAVWGNHDYGGGASRQYASIMERAGFQLLKNENLHISLENGKELLFTGLDDSLLGNPDLPDEEPDHSSEYRVLLTHEPDVVTKYLNYKYDVIFSGHSHGGQINVPFLPFINDRAVAATALSSRYTGGMYTLESQGMLYVSTGIGTTHISARFGVVPEIAVFHLYL